MKTASSILQAVTGIAGLTLIVLGVLFWTGRAYQFLPLHIGLGVVLVVALWVQAVLAARAGAKPGTVFFALLWGGLVFAFGMIQTSLLPGDYHWVIRVVHLVFGIFTMRMVGTLGRQVLHGEGDARQGAHTGRTVQPHGGGGT